MRNIIILPANDLRFGRAGLAQSFLGRVEFARSSVVVRALDRTSKVRFVAAAAEVERIRATTLVEKPRHG